ncbi:Uncharacterized protein PCOAH_00014960 [Plasmodium coatneyi]|uniref:Uncharacterized protein n=1 Tax=Plasmodium coatneyi TaxID=208452 RepID=A0A1B1DW77_9APIC|nr:Uncharacterized protein PCOAH_00014960 [Plasmodium coatneyi]ANQ07004.1 Uncharacterized protein PCOAH_00014960 [Plasmodium coatneyi]
MEEKKRRTKGIVTAEEMKATREDRVLRKFEDVKNKWDKQRQLIKERTKKKGETLADQGEKYRERNEVMRRKRGDISPEDMAIGLNTLIEHLNKEEKKKVNWTENLRAESGSIRFKEAVKKVNLEGGLCKGNREIFEKEGDDRYVTNRDAKKKLYEGQIINKIKSNLEFVLKNFAIPLDSAFVVQGRKVDLAEAATVDEVGNANEEALPTACNIEDTTHDRKVDTPSNEQPLRTSKQVIRIENRGRKVIPNSIELHNTSSSIVVFTISYKKKLKLENEVLRQKDYLFFDEHKNYTLVISPNAGYLKPGEKKTISLTFFFHYFVNTFGTLTIRYLCNEQVFQRDVSVQVDSFHDIGGTVFWGDSSSGGCSPSANLAQTKNGHGGAPLKNPLKTFFFYTKGRVFSSANHFCNHEKELTLEMIHPVKDDHVKVSPPSGEFTSEGSLPNGGDKIDEHHTTSSLYRNASVKKNLSESFHEAVKQYVVTLVKSYVSVHGGDEGQGIPLSTQNKVPTRAHENEHHSSHTSKRGKEPLRGVKGGESPPSIDEQNIAFAKDTFFKHLLRSFPNALNKSYLATLLHMALEQALLTRSHSLYLRRYFDILQFVRITMLREKTWDDLPPEGETIFVQTNAHLLSYIVGFVHDLYRSNRENHQVNHIKEVFFYFLSSAFLCIRRGVRNVILFVDANKGGSITMGEDFFHAVFHSFMFSYVRAFLSAQGKTHYALHFVRGESDVSQVCEAILSQRGHVKEDGGDDVPTQVACDDAICKVDGTDGETPPEDDFFKNFKADEDYANCFSGESGGDKSPHGGGDNKKGNIVFVEDREVFARAVYEWHYGRLVGKVESRLASAQVGQADHPSAVLPTNGLPTDDAPTTGDPITLMKKKTATGKMKKKKNAKGGKGTVREGSSIPHRGRSTAEGTMSQNDDPTDEPTGSKEHPCTNHHLEKLFDILGVSTYIIDDHIEAERKKCMHVPEGIQVQVGMVATKMVNILPFVFNVISVKQLDKLYRQERHANYFLYDYFVLRNRDRLLEAMRKIVHYVDEQGDISDKNNLFGKIPLPCDYDVGPFEQGKNSTTMQQEDTLIGEENHTPPREVTPKYLWIISPNIKNDLLDMSNLSDMIEWLKLLNLAICMKVSDVYICGQLFFLFLFFMCDSGSLPGRWCQGGGKRNNQAYLRIDVDNPTRRCPSAGETHEVNHDPSHVKLDFFDVKHFPEPLLLLLKVNLFNILQLCDWYQIRLHFPHDMILHLSESLRRSTSTSPLPSLYCRFPYKNYNQMIQASRRKFLRTYGHRLANLGSFTREILKRGESPQGKSNWEEKPFVRDDEEVVAIPVDPPPPTEQTASSPQRRVRVCSQDVGRRTLNNIVGELRGADKVLWLCGAFERDPKEQGSYNSVQLLYCIAAAQREEHKLSEGDQPKGDAPQFSPPDQRDVMHVNNLIVLNEDVYALYHRQPRKDANIPFLFPSHRVLVHLFDRTFPQSGFFSPF